MGLVLKHVERTKAGAFQYRRRVPKDVAGKITKREFKRKLGDSEKEALRAYPQYHAEVEREIDRARQRQSMAEAASSADASEREAYAEALRRRADLIEAGATKADLVLTGETMMERYPQDEYEPVGVPPVDRYTINLLRLGPDRIKTPEPTLEDARKLYLKEKLDADNPATDSRVVGLANRVIATTIKAIGRVPVLTTLTRDDARKVRDEMLDRVKTTGRGVGEKVSPTTVSRELSIVAAVINLAAKEFNLPGSFQNPFNDLPVVRVRKGEGQKASDKRDPLPPKVLEQVRARVIAGASPELALIWRLIEGTGCRISEVTGLRVEDVVATGDMAFIRIEPHPLRRLKTSTSRREVPLVGDTLAAAQEALKLSREGNMVFPSYGRVRGSDAASAALMKHVRAVTKDEKHVIHSLRHNMKDRLILAEVSTLDQNLILGHTLGGVGDSVYGGRVAKLRQTTKAMKKALGVPLSEADGQQTSEREDGE